MPVPEERLARIEFLDPDIVQVATPRRVAGLPRADLPSRWASLLLLPAVNAALAAAIDRDGADRVPPPAAIPLLVWNAVLAASPEQEQAQAA